MRGYLVAGEISSDLSVLRLNPDKLRQLPPQAGIMNLADEAVLVVDDRVATIHEANGVNVNPNPVSHLFGLYLQPLGTVPFPTLEYRVTDATSPDSKGRFWVINYYFPGEGPLLKPPPDHLPNEYDPSDARSVSTAVERLVELEYSKNGITLTETRAIYLEKTRYDRPRNWEGLVRLEKRGFLVVTDKFPTTLLAFVPLPPG